MFQELVTMKQLATQCTHTAQSFEKKKLFQLNHTSQVWETLFTSYFLCKNFFFSYFCFGRPSSPIPLFFFFLTEAEKLLIGKFHVSGVMVMTFQLELFHSLKRKQTHSALAKARKMNWKSRSRLNCFFFSFFGASWKKTINWWQRPEWWMWVFCSFLRRRTIGTVQNNNHHIGSFLRKCHVVPSIGETSPSVYMCVNAF